MSPSPTVALASLPPRLPAQVSSAPHLLEGLLVGRKGSDHLRQCHGDTAHALREGGQQAHTFVYPVLVAREAVQPKQVVGRHGVGAGLGTILVCRGHGGRTLREGPWALGPCPRTVARPARGMGRRGVPLHPPWPRSEWNASTAVMELLLSHMHGQLPCPRRTVGSPIPLMTPPFNHPAASQGGILLVPPFLSPPTSNFSTRRRLALQPEETQILYFSPLTLLPGPGLCQRLPECHQQTAS